MKLVLNWNLYQRSIIYTAETLYIRLLSLLKCQRCVCHFWKQWLTFVQPKHTNFTWALLANNYLKFEKTTATLAHTKIKARTHFSRSRLRSTPVFYLFCVEKKVNSSGKFSALISATPEGCGWEKQERTVVSGAGNCPQTLYQVALKENLLVINLLDWHPRW